ncbi:ribosome silencing factor [Ferrimonas balearica]|uniref:ribosome silencing factor n=1 Tax=Ferrimonas balearica TaxID=44012 RepID=UPI001C9961E8|nr:ribosome silencing factor [Ferrimonas balearica]MBY5990524.1 ribosome silencing factor [Ferrimonas balearica]
MQAVELKDFAVDKLDDLKGRDIVVLDVSDRSDVTDYMVVCTGTSKTHVRSLAENLVSEAKDAGLQPLGIEGKESGEWVLVDLSAVIVHVMQEQTRDHYQLEKLWSAHPGQ